MYVPKESSDMKHANLVFKKDGRVLSISFDDNCGAYKVELRRTHVLIWDENDNDLLDEHWVSNERFLDILADFLGKKVVDKEE